MSDSLLPPGGRAWLNRFVEPELITALSGFRVLSAVDSERGRRVVVVAQGARQSVSHASAALRRLYEAHSSVDHPMVAPAVEIDEDASFVVFDIPARLELARLLELARGHQIYRIPHAQADAFVYYLREGLTEAASGSAGVPYYLGEVAFGNALLAADGRFWLLGLGHNVVTRDEMGRLGGCPVFSSPEVALGGPPSEMGDYIALIAMSRALMPFTRLAPAVMQVASKLARADVKLLKMLRWYEHEVLAVPAEDRPSVARCVDVANDIRDHLGIYPDLSGFEASAADVISSRSELTRETANATWVLAADAEELRGSDAVVALRAGTPASRLITGLLELREERPGATYNVEELFEIGWPGEKASRRSSANRVYVTINTLRRRGLGSDLETCDGGYRLSPAAVWVRE